MRWTSLLSLHGLGDVNRRLFSLPRGGLSGQGGDKSLTLSVARAWLRILLARLGRSSEGFSFHLFRRRACTSAFLAGASKGDIRSLGGWRSEAVRCYLPIEESRRRAARALTAFSHQQV